MHAARLAKAIGAPRVIVPFGAGVGSAIGLLRAVPKIEVSVTRVMEVAAANVEAMRAIYDELERRAAADLDRLGVAGDLNAQLNANRAGAERLAAMFREQGASRMKAAFDQVLSASEARMRELIAAMPDGSYSFDDRVDDYGPGTDPIDVCVDVTIQGDSIEVDFSRSSDQVPAAVNSCINYTRAYTVCPANGLSRTIAQARRYCSAACLAPSGKTRV